MQPTESQRAAIAHRDGHLQLIACAGSGKTEVVARRVAALLCPTADGSPSLEPRNLIAFTFTEKAAGELKERITARVHDSLGEVPGLAEMFVGTIHGFCLDLLRNEVPSFVGRTVLDEVTQRMLVERHPERSGRASTRTLWDAELAPWKDTGVYLNTLDVLRQADLVPGKLEGSSAVEALAAWRALLDDRGYLDFTSIMEHAVRALRDDADLRARLAARVRHVIVDEYQDVNPIQERVVRALADLGAWLCVVGDDDQSIYQWNGASVGNILRFAERYPGTRTLRLQENFRSSRAIVDLARGFIAQNRERLPKEMIATGAQPDDPGDVVARSFRHPRDEAAWLAERFVDLHGAAFQDGSRRRGLAWSDLCVLVRSDLRRNAGPIVEAFRARGIPYLVSGLNNLFATPEAQAAAALFRYLADAEGAVADDVRIAWAAACPGISVESLDAGLAYADAVRDEVAYADDEGAWELLPQRVFLEFLARVGMRAEAVAGERGQAEVVLANLGVVSQLLGDFEGVHHRTAAAPKYARLVDFLENAAKDQYAEALLDSPLASPDAVRIMTIHKAKGLQWPVVAVPGLVESRFPSKTSPQDPRRKKRKDWWDLIPLDAVVDGARYQGVLDDERRLFYVAITRSQKHLLLSFSPSPEFSFWRTPSQFFRWASTQPEVSAVDVSPRERLAPEGRHGVANVRLDFSTIKSLFECPQRFQLQAVYGFSAPPEAAQGFGAALHDALAEVHRRAREGHRCTADEVPALVADHLRLPFATPEVAEQRRVQAERMLTRYLASRGDTLDAVEFVEQAIELPMGDGVTVSGRIDLVVRRKDGRASIVDLKSSAHAQSELQTQAQLHLYALGYRALTGRDAKAVEVWELDHDTRDARPVDDAMLDGIRATALEAAAMLREGRFPPAAEASRCSRCAMRALCPAGQAAIATGAGEWALSDVPDGSPTP
jgi:DNA helicase-2/ATP-dependent DNA helicase PcrA